MAKTIKFNLILDGESVRDLEALKEHFSIEDILRYYRGGLLQRWLSVRGFQDEYHKVNAIDEKGTDINVLKQLVHIFDIDTDEEEIEAIFDNLEYMDKERQLNAEYRAAAMCRDDYIAKYHKEYHDIIVDLIIDKNDMCSLKRNVDIIKRRYRKLFELDFGRLYFKLKEDAPKAIFSILCNPDLRECWMKSENPDIMKDFTDTFLNTTTLKEILEGDLKSIKRNTNYEWECIEEKKRIMILEVAYGSSVKEANADAEILNSSEVRTLLPIWNGVDYRSRNSMDELLYMEV